MLFAQICRRCANLHCANLSTETIFPTGDSWAVEEAHQSPISSQKIFSTVTLLILYCTLPVLQSYAPARQLRTQARCHFVHVMGAKRHEAFSRRNLSFSLVLRKSCNSAFSQLTRAHILCTLSFYRRTGYFPVLSQAHKKISHAPT